MSKNNFKVMSSYCQYLAEVCDCLFFKIFLSQLLAVFRVEAKKRIGVAAFCFKVFENLLSLPIGRFKNAFFLCGLKNYTPIKISGFKQLPWPRSFTKRSDRYR